ncbi:hypothetical protein GVO57_13520 [Sphingomonas changnyeongensis]|uniref:Uncharacterized protein n=1 Tax=Sphingomonas changnyeongensis TaxID=2698679 RepID=A0A7Z2NYB1_9SPHN|nr:hypothetical protein [Sphingomonas changnyeongensis]QHL91630.1 hypothetical protein GVO57_13520 [Sphingomonas changnyeongensis]
MDDLLLAVLAMDAYNRGNSPTLSMGSAHIGDATYIDTIVQDNISFSASVYIISSENNNLANSDRVISYRGTDSFLYDPIAGWPTQLGGLSAQAVEALRVYNDYGRGFAGSTIITGHSLGGGLAGYVAALHGLPATLIANMAFEAAAATVRQTAIAQDELGLSELRNAIYGDGPITDLNTSRIKTLFVDGEVNQILRIAQTTPQVALPFQSPYLYPNQSINLHSSALHALLTYARHQDIGFSSWESAAQIVLDSFFSNEIANRIGFSDLLGTGSASTKMNMAIAYSVVDGPDSRKPWGDTAARSFFNDAQDLAVAQSSSSAPSVYTVSAPLLANTAIEYAGLLAKNSILISQDQERSLGALRVSDNQASITVDFRERMWTFGNSAVDPSERSNLIDQALSSSGVEDGLDQAFSWFSWLSRNDIKQITYQIAPAATANSSLILETSSEISMLVLAPYYQSVVLNDNSGTHITVGSVAGDIVQGSSNIDIILGGDGNDTLFGNDGWDFLRGDAGDDEIWGGSGWNYLDGGAGDDRLISQGDGDYIFGGNGNDTIIIMSQGKYNAIEGGSGNDIIEAYDSALIGFWSDSPNYVMFDYGGGQDIIRQANVGAFFELSDGSIVERKTWGISSIDMGSIPMSDVTIFYDPIIIYADWHPEIGTAHDLVGNLTVRVNSTGDSIELGEVFSTVYDSYAYGNPYNLLNSTWYLKMPPLIFNGVFFHTAGEEGINLVLGAAPGLPSLPLTAMVSHSVVDYGYQTEQFGALLVNHSPEISWFNIA